MKIIILGGGQVGRSVAANLAGEANDITVVDRDPEISGNSRTASTFGPSWGMAPIPTCWNGPGPRTPI